MTVEIRRGSARFVTRETGRETRHTFSFGPHYDPERLGFGALVCHDEHLLRAGAGFDTHRHSGLVILTYVVDGVVRHQHGDDAPRDLAAGDLGVLVTGKGVDHSEHAALTPTRFVQFWIADPDADDRPVAHDVHPAGPGASEVALPVPGAHAAVLRLAAGEAATLPAAGRLYAAVARGALLRSSLAEPLQAGDAFAMTEAEAYEVTAAVDTDIVVLSLG